MASVKENKASDRTVKIILNQQIILKLNSKFTFRYNFSLSIFTLLILKDFKISIFFLILWKQIQSLTAICKVKLSIARWL